MQGPHAAVEYFGLFCCVCLHVVRCVFLKGRLVHFVFFFFFGRENARIFFSLEVWERNYDTWLASPRKSKSQPQRSNGERFLVWPTSMVLPTFRTRRHKSGKTGSTRGFAWTIFFLLVAPFICLLASLFMVLPEALGCSPSK